MEKEYFSSRSKKTHKITSILVVEKKRKAVESYISRRGNVRQVKEDFISKLPGEMKRFVNKMEITPLKFGLISALLDSVQSSMAMRSPFPSRNGPLSLY